jgi:uncharacterized delta-60 repeat protein
MRIIFTPLLLILFFISCAQDGSLDISYGSSGKAVVFPTMPAVYERNKIVLLSDGLHFLQCFTASNASNDFGMVRYNMDGSVDPTFGTSGYITTDLGGDDHVYAMTVTSTGKIILAGSSSGQFAIARYNSDGTLDATFNTTGKRVLAIGTNAVINAVVESGNVITVGGTSQQGTNFDFSLARFTSTGTLDATFGTGGIVTTSINGTSDDGINSIALQTDSKIVAAGNTTSGGVSQFALARYTTAGTLDAGFGVGGIVTTAIGTTDDAANAVAIQNTTGKIVAAGSSFNGVDYDFAIVRYTSTGTAELTTTKAIGSLDDIAYDVAIQSDGKILVAGSTETGASQLNAPNDFVIMRLNTDGSTDITNFGDNPGTGTTTIDFGLAPVSDDNGYDIALGSNFIMFGGMASGGLGASTGGLATARLFNSSLVLPVHLMGFTASKLSQSVTLSWQSVNELGVDSYEIERSSDGTHFSKIGVVTATSSNNSIKKYSFEDFHPASINFYRLKIINTSSRPEYSMMIIVRFEIGRSLLASPNPVRSTLNLQITQPKGPVSVQLFDVSGRLVNKAQFHSDGSTFSTAINMSNLHRGIYLVKVNNEVVKLIKE